MAKTSGPAKTKDAVVDAIKDLMIVQLGLAGIPQRTIQKIVGCDLNRVTRIARHIRTKNVEASSSKKKE